MKKIFIILFMIICLNNLKIKAQAGVMGDVSQILQSSVDDANKLIGAYMQPIIRGSIYNMGNGWYNTAKTHRFPGFDVTFNLSYAVAPIGARNFNVNDLNLQNLTVAKNSGNIAPTIYGDASTNLSFKFKKEISLTQTTQAIVSQIQSNYSNEYNLLTQQQKDQLTTVVNTVSTASSSKTYTVNKEFGNIPLKGLKEVANSKIIDAIPDNFFGAPLPLLQAGIGLPLEFELDFRYIPTIEQEDMKFGSFGLAVKHEFKRWIPGLKSVPIDISALIAFNRMNLETSIDYNSVLNKSIAKGDIIKSNSFKMYNDQKVSASINSFTTMLLVSKKLLFFTPYIGLGFVSGGFDLGFKGHYAIPGIVIDKTKLGGLATGSSIDDLVKPGLVNEGDNNYVVIAPGENKTFSSIHDNAFSPSATLGFRVQFLLISIHAQYSFQEYSMYNFGLGVSFR